ncbi:MAG TPA: hypothetical protein VD999_00705 [Vitreimonas sp.]|nr:hypothetical protein [Vitreimonas sp.]
MPRSFFTPYLLISTVSQPPRELVQQFLSQHPELPQLSLTHPNVMVINEESEGLKIETLRNLLSELALMPPVPGSRLVVIAGFETAQPVAQQVLLKTLEEPPSDTLILLITQTLEAILPTIQSRCRSERVGDTTAGNQRDAASAQSTAIQPLLELLKTGNYSDLIKTVEKISEREEAVNLVSELVRQYQTQLTQRGTPEVMKVLLTASDHLKTNANVKLILENALFRIRKVSG